MRQSRTVASYEAEINCELISMGRLKGTTLAFLIQTIRIGGEYDRSQGLPRGTTEVLVSTEAMERHDRGSVINDRGSVYSDRGSGQVTEVLSLVAILGLT